MQGIALLPGNIAVNSPCSLTPDFRAEQSAPSLSREAHAESNPSPTGRPGETPTDSELFLLNSSTFPVLGVPTNLVAVLANLDITTPTPIQAATLPDSLAGRDVLGRGRTGSGKTYAFLLPIVARTAASRRTTRPGSPRALILAPTRELVGQIHAALIPLANASKLSTMTIFGGVGQGPQVNALRRGADIVVATPGRLEDLIQQRHVSLNDVEITVLDEADHMADLGFLPAMRRILDQTPQSGQRMLFSATLDKAIDVLVRRYLTNPAVHEADSAQSPISTMSHHVLHVDRTSRLSVLVDLTSAPGRTVVFTRTKHGAKALARQLNREGVPTVDLHGNLSQGARTRNMDAFHSGKATTLVATDIAARGIHVDDVALVVHADPPMEHKAYLHRSGRTARAGAEGTVITLMTDEQQRDVRALTKAAGITPQITRIDGGSHPMLRTLAPGDRVRGGGLPVSEEQPRQRSGGSTGRNAQRKASQRGGSGGGRSRNRSGQSANGKPANAKPASGGQASSRPAKQASRKPKTTSGSGARTGGGNRSHSAASFSSGRR